MAASYFITIFGRPDPDKDPVESGLYELGSGFPPIPTVPGDIMLLYCTEEYSKYSKQVPGIGIVFRIIGDSVEYRWLPFSTPIPRLALQGTFEDADFERMKHLQLKSNRIIPVSRQSFERTVTGRSLEWSAGSPVTQTA
jgi:hypothetical protein